VRLDQHVSVPVVDVAVSVADLADAGLPTRCQASGPVCIKPDVIVRAADEIRKRGLA
jgi:hypothetical protein